jgi:cytoskeletal protein CcmA (bactofilin family)
VASSAIEDGPARELEASMAGESLRIKGEITANEDLRFEGEIEGTISVPEHTLIVGRTARIHADVKARAIIVAGSLVGSAVARDRCEVQEAAVVEGTIDAPKLAVKDGATLIAKVAMPMPSDAAPAKDAPAKQAEPAAAETAVVHHDFTPQASVA